MVAQQEHRGAALGMRDLHGRPVIGRLPSGAVLGGPTAARLDRFSSNMGGKHRQATREKARLACLPARLSATAFRLGHMLKCPK